MMKKDDLGYIKQKSRSGNVILVFILAAALGIAGGLTAIKTTEDFGKLAAVLEQTDQGNDQEVIQK